MSKQETPKPDIMVQAINSDVPQTYANGFQISFGSADVALLLQRNGQNVEILNLSFTVAKSLAEILSKVVQDIESTTGMNIKTTHELTRALESARNDDQPK